MKKPISKILAVGVILLCLGASAVVSAKQATRAAPQQVRSWGDNFDSYTNGQLLDGTPDDGGWKGWDNVPSAAGIVTNVQSRSAPNSDQIWSLSDNVHEYSGYTAGQWVYTAYQYIPQNFSGISYFILLSDYTDGAGQNNKWALQMHFDSDLMLVESEFDAIDLPLVEGQWVQIRVEIDLTNDNMNVFYNNELLVSKAWTAGPNNLGDGVLAISAVDLFANSASPVYYDDISLVPQGTALTCDAGGPYTGKINQAIQFNGFASGGTEPYTFAWTFGDGGTGTGQNPTHAYTAAGTYNVTLTVTDANAQTATDTAVATVTAPAPEIVIGNITGGFGVKAVIKNIGDADATGVAWKIEVSGGFILIGKSKTGTADIAMGASVTEKSMVFGFSKAATIKVTAGTASKTATGKVILFFVTGVA